MWHGRCPGDTPIPAKPTWPPRSPDLTVCDLFLWGLVRDNVYVPPLQKTLQELRERINNAIGNVTQDMLQRVWRDGSIAWTSAVSQEGRISNAFKVTMKLQTFLFQMVVTSLISVQYLWKYGFAKSSDNLYAPCMLSKILFIHASLFWSAKRKMEPTGRHYGCQRTYQNIKKCRAKSGSLGRLLLYQTVV